MAFTCGFFNSQNGDRKYNAEQMASIFDGLIKDGVYDTVGEIFAVTPGTGMQVLVGSGRAWFDHTWNNNDASYPLAITAADVSLPRYDAVVLETNHSDTVRTNRLRVLTGTPASNPAKPTMASSANVKQHPLAYIKVTAGAKAITQSMIQVVVGTSECPFVTGIIDTAEIDALFQQWNGEFNEWFENLKAQLSDNVVANLQAQIDQKVAKADVATKADIEAGTSTTKWVTPKGLKDSGIGVNGTAYDVTTGKMVQIQTNMSHYIADKDFEWMPRNIGLEYCGLCLFRNGVLIPTAKIRSVNGNNKYYPCIYIYDNARNMINKFESTENFTSIQGSQTYAGYGEYECCIIDEFNDDRNIIYQGAYFRHRNIIASRSTINDRASRATIETKNYAMYYIDSNGQITIYYNANPANNSIIDNWNKYQFSLETEYTNYSHYILGAYEQYIYIGNYANNKVYGGGTIYRVDLSTKSYTTLVNFNTQSITDQKLRIDPNNCIAIDYPYMYQRIIKYNSSIGYAKVLKIDLRNGSNNLDNVISSEITSSSVPNYVLLGHDSQYIYAYNGDSTSAYSNEYLLYRISKSTANVELIPSLVLNNRNSFIDIPKQLLSQDYANIFYGNQRIDVATASIINSMYSEGTYVDFHQQQNYYSAVCVTSRNTHYLGYNRSSSPTSSSLIYNPNVTPYRYSDQVIIKE